MKSVVLVVEQMSRWDGYEITPTSGVYKLTKTVMPKGLDEALERGAELVEQMDSRESRTALSVCYYTKWKVRFPITLIEPLRNHEFDKLFPTADLPHIPL